MTQCILIYGVGLGLTDFGDVCRVKIKHCECVSVCCVGGLNGALVIGTKSDDQNYIDK